MLVIGIDPGPEHSALVSWDGEKVEWATEESNLQIVAALQSQAHLRGRTDVWLAIEQIRSYGLAVGQAVLDTSMWSGRFAQAWVDTVGAPVVWLDFSTVRLELCRSRRAKEPEVRRALLDKIGEPGTKKAPNPTYAVKVTGHCWSALAVAVVAVELSVWRIKEGGV